MFEIGEQFGLLEVVELHSSFEAKVDLVVARQKQVSLILANTQKKIHVLR